SGFASFTSGVAFGVSVRGSFFAGSGLGGSGFFSSTFGTSGGSGSFWTGGGGGGGGGGSGVRGASLGSSRRSNSGSRAAATSLARKTPSLSGAFAPGAAELTRWAAKKRAAWKRIDPTKQRVKTAMPRTVPNRPVPAGALQARRARLRRAGATAGTGGAAAADGAG